MWYEAGCGQPSNPLSRPSGPLHCGLPDRLHASACDRVVAFLPYYTGLRDSEVVRLDVSDVRLFARRSEFRVLGEARTGQAAHSPRPRRGAGSPAGLPQERPRRPGVTARPWC